MLAVPVVTCRVSKRSRVLRPIVLLCVTLYRACSVALAPLPLQLFMSLSCGAVNALATSALLPPSPPQIPMLVPLLLLLSVSSLNTDSKRISSTHYGCYYRCQPHQQRQNELDEAVLLAVAGAAIIITAANILL